MARRTIRARRASPYMLYLCILFAVAMVAGWVLFAWMYTRTVKYQEQTLGAAAVEQAADIDQAFSQVVSKAKSALPPEKAAVSNLDQAITALKNLAEEYRFEITRLTQAVSGDPYENQFGNQLRQSVSNLLADTDVLVDQVRETLETSIDFLPQGQRAGAEAALAGLEGDPTGAPGAEGAAAESLMSLMAALKLLDGRVESLMGRVGEQNQTVAGLNRQIEGLRQEKETVAQNLQAEVSQANATLTDERNRLTQLRQQADQLAQQLKDQLNLREEEHIKTRRVWEDDRGKLEMEIARLKERIKDLQGIVEEFRKVPTRLGIDGEIVSVVEGGEVAYGDIREGDGVPLGMTFSIFSRKDLGKEAADPKAMARVVKITEHACELRIYEARQPVIVGDVLHNPVYDRQRRLGFTLIGRMDFDGDGLDDTDALKAMVQEWGGRVDDELTVRTDYLIIGEQPEVMPAPSPTEIQQMEAYRRSREAFVKYTSYRAQAQAFSIPVLTLNRFLSLVGMVGGG